MLADARTCAYSGGMRRSWTVLPRAAFVAVGLVPAAFVLPSASFDQPGVKAHIDAALSLVLLVGICALPFVLLARSDFRSTSARRAMIVALAGAAALAGLLVLVSRQEPMRAFDTATTVRMYGAPLSWAVAALCAVLKVKVCERPVPPGVTSLDRWR